MKLKEWALKTGVRVAAIAVGFTAIAGMLVFHSLQLQKLAKSVEDVEWQSAISNANQDAETIAPTVGVIQFLKNGFAITLDTVDYTPAGLRLAGFLGNPKALNVSSLTLVVEAMRPPYQVRTTDASIFDLFFQKPISTAQANVGYLWAGSTERFALTLSSLTQAQSDSIELRVRFSGERYTYTR